MLKKGIIGFCAGLVSGLFATGGGLILVPAFVYLLKENEQESKESIRTIVRNFNALRYIATAGYGEI